MTVQQSNDIETILQSGIFDETYYLRQAGLRATTAEDAVQHFLTEGCSKGLNPHPLFNTNYYLRKNPDVARAGVNPLIHYITQGGFENRQPSEHFDGYYYLSQNADVKALKQNPLSHFILCGAHEGRQPSVVFDTKFYLNHYPDVKESGQNALAHFVTRGQSEGRRPNSRPLYPRELYLRMRQLEPILPKFESLQTLRESKESFISKAGIVYNKFKEEISQPFSHLYVASNELNSLEMLETILKSLETTNVPRASLVLITGRINESTENAIEGLRKSTQVVVLQSYGKKLEAEEELQIISRLAIQTEPHIIHGIGSKVCLDLFRRMQKPLSLKSKLFASALSFQVDEEGNSSGSNLFLNACADGLSAVFARDAETMNLLIEKLGFDNETRKRIIVYPGAGADIDVLRKFDYFTA